VSRVGAVPDLLEDGKTARLVDPGDSGQIARAVLELLDDPSLGDRLAEGAAGVAADIASPDRSLAVFKEAMGRVGVSAS
jgi:glycosyltransferase involved in cell wall biosynthesis